MKDVNMTANISFNIVASPDATDMDLATAVAKIALSRGKTFANGTGSNQVNTWWANKQNITGGSNVTIDLQGGGAEVDAYGNSLDIDKLKMLFIKNNSDAAMIVGPHATGISITGDPTAHTIPIPVGGEILLIFSGDGIAVEAADKDLFISAAGAGAKEAEIIIVGVTS